MAYDNDKLPALPFARFSGAGLIFALLFIPAAVEAARFTVYKNFSDDNPAAVEVVLNCNSGDSLQQRAMVVEGQPVTFTVRDYDSGQLNCEVTEGVPEGYLPLYVNQGIGNSDESCSYRNVSEGAEFSCVIVNNLQPVRLDVHKQWINDRAEFLGDLRVRITLSCDTEIESVGGPPDENETGGVPAMTRETWIDPENPGEFWLYPAWDGTHCSVTEEPGTDFIGDVGRCETLTLVPGRDSSCTIVNTRFYEGIPTLGFPGLGLLGILVLAVALIRIDGAS